MFDNFYISSDFAGSLKGHNTLTWQPFKLLDEYEKSLIKSSPLINNNPYKKQVAYVRVGDLVGQGEQAYLDVRLPRVKAALRKFLGKKLNGSFIPKIALINSGGGARALIACLGWHVGAQEIGLLDAVTYDIGLSGGAWFVGTWIAAVRLLLNLKIS